MNQRLTIPHSRTVAGLLLAVAPFAVLLVAGLQEVRWIDLPMWKVVTSSASAVLLVVASLLVMRRSPAAVATTVIGTAAGIAPVYDVFLARPGISLLLFMGVCYLFFATFPIKRDHYKPSNPDWSSGAQTFFRGTLLGYGTLWGMLLVADWPFERYIVTELFAVSTLVPCLAGFVWIASEFKGTRTLRWRPLAAVCVIAIGSLAGLLHDSSWLETVGVIGIATAMLIVDEGISIEDRAPWWRLVAGHPERLLFSTFLVLCASGAILLSLSVSSSPDTDVSILDAVFTAVSAVCVTGLVVLDTPHDFTFAGQLFILMLIQAGGLGIMTFSTAAIRLLGPKMSLRHEAAVARLLSSEDRNRVFDSTRNIIWFTIAFESVGADSERRHPALLRVTSTHKCL